MGFAISQARVSLEVFVLDKTLRGGGLGGRGTIWWLTGPFPCIFLESETCGTLTHVIARVWPVGLLGVARFVSLHPSRFAQPLGLLGVQERLLQAMAWTNPKYRLQVEKLCLCFICWGQQGGLVAPGGLASKPSILAAPGGLGDGSVGASSPSGKATHRKELADGSQAPIPRPSVAALCQEGSCPWYPPRACPACVVLLRLPWGFLPRLLVLVGSLCKTF